MYKQPRNVFKILDHKPVYLFLQWDCNFGCAIQAGRVGQSGQWAKQCYFSAEHKSDQFIHYTGCQQNLK